MLVVYYRVQYVDPNRWIPLEFAVRMPKQFRGEVEYYLSSDDLSVQRDVHLTQRWFDSVEDSLYYRWFKLPRTIPYQKGKLIWLSPKGSLYYADARSPATDHHKRYLGKAPEHFRTGYQVDVRELRRRMDKIGVSSTDASVAERTLSDLCAICTALPFVDTYAGDLAVLSEEMADAKHCLTDHEKRILQLRAGNPGERPLAWRKVADHIKQGAMRASQIADRAIRKLKQRILWNRARKRMNLPIDRTTADY